MNEIKSIGGGGWLMFVHSIQRISISLFNQLVKKNLISTHEFSVVAWDAVALVGTGNLDKNGSTNNSPIELRWLFLLFFSPFFRFNRADEPLLKVPTGGPCNDHNNNEVNKAISCAASHSLRKIKTFDIDITPSKFAALFLAENKSSLQPETSPWRWTEACYFPIEVRTETEMIVFTYKVRWKILPHVLIRIFFPLWDILLVEENLFKLGTCPWKFMKWDSQTVEITFSFITSAGKIADSSKDVKWGDTNFHP